jgi:formylglycine-generating enzyme required for sulfatase activity
MRLRSTSSFAFSVLVAFAFFVACSSADLHPAPGGDPDGGGLGTFEAGGRGDGAADSSAEAASTTCMSQLKDGLESDIDCGGTGNGCARCPLGKACSIDGDCALGAQCMNKICSLCQDKMTNGDESDTDCGGKACGACTVGKRCTAGTDCTSGTCTNNACACPKDMTIVSLATGGAYCIDASEVTKGQYFQFITANVSVATQTNTACKAANTTFIPRGAWPPASAPDPPGIVFSMGLPVHYVDWCDAAAYCTWAKKQLCGLVGGGTLPTAQSGDQEKSAWYNACSAQGQKAYPYAAVTFDNTKCNSDGIGASGPETAAQDRSQGFGFSGTNADEGVYRVAISDAAGVITAPDHTNCLGGAVGLYQMSGNVAEWEDSCAGTAATDTCRVRGGSYADSSADQKCTSTRDVVRMPAAPVVGDPDPLKDVGFRCCQY